jgi:MFS family permease
MLFGARALQGVFAALLAPSALSLLATTFTDPKDRGKAFGIFGAIIGAGAAVGLLAGGFLTEYLDWRWCLYVNVPIALVAFAGALTLLQPGERHPGGRLDVPGALLGSAGMLSVVYGFSEAGSYCSARSASGRPGRGCPCCRCRWSRTGSGWARS